jgi:hypothetical protein
VGQQKNGNTYWISEDTAMVTYLETDSTEKRRGQAVGGVIQEILTFAYSTAPHLEKSEKLKIVIV